MATEHLDVVVREGRGRSCRNRLRAEGKIPAVVYGRAVGSLPVEVETRAVERLIDRHGAGGLVELGLKGGGRVKKYHAIIKDIQYHPIKRHLQHVDFQQISLKEDVTTHVPLRLVGEAPGAKKGGVVEQHLRQVEVSCLPTRIPEAIDVDISGLDLGESLHVKDVNVPEGVRLLTDEEISVVSISAPRREALEPEAAEAEEKAAETPPAEE
ncbi:MAG: 50S ribosomal protein L25/general stress protein Ctc [Thermoanaerobacterales bacterium]|nr:50S ribosomal protein L25/general stress protein Ctc [Bacillota bacterium]MDI6907262.1 50S ribosomal protein L25/general stress protein Ctc [Thermoanaerobacterales bacterium]